MHRHHAKHIVILLKAGQSVRPHKLYCSECLGARGFHSTMMKVNREVHAVLQDSQGIHWADVPDCVTVIEHKCRGCGTVYHIYTPDTVRAEEEAINAIAGAQLHV